MAYCLKFSLVCKTCLTVLVFLCWHSLNAQSIKRQSISSFGSSATDGSITVQSAAGQSSATVATYNTQASLRSGFMQPPLVKTLFNAYNVARLTIYPNPATVQTTIDFEFLEADEIILSTNSGQVAFTVIINTPASSLRLNLENLASETYAIILLRNKTIIGYSILSKL